MMSGIPTSLDRFIAQAILQVLTPIFDAGFSESSYGFLPGRSAQMAVKQAQAYIQSGHRWVVDLDLEKFFDRVNHDILMGRVARKITDKRLLKLIRRFLEAGMMNGGIVSQSGEGTPQGSPLSPLLSNILLDDPDKELERRGHVFCRYADDCNIYVCSSKAGGTSDGFDYKVPGAKAETKGESIQERRRPPLETKVTWIHGDK